MRNLPAGTASALGIVEPMAATVYSILFLGEDLNIIPAIGILLILGAVFLLGKAEDSNNPDNEEKIIGEKEEKEYELHQN
jgi:drug/metabolite transporter (DMT)-like permease